MQHNRAAGTGTDWQKYPILNIRRRSHALFILVVSERIGLPPYGLSALTGFLMPEHARASCGRVHGTCEQANTGTRREPIDKHDAATAADARDRG